MWSLLQKKPCDYTLNKLNQVDCCNTNNGTISNKYYDIAYFVALDNTGVTGLLNDPARGTDVNQRIGNTFNNVRLLVRYWISIQIPTPTFELARMIIFWDNGYNEAFEPPNKNDLVVEGEVLGHYNWSNQERFDILYDKTFTLGTAYYSGAGNPNTTIMTVKPCTYFDELIIDLQGRQTTFASSGDVELVTGQLQVLMWGTNTTSVGVANCDFFSRVIYTDK